jgi:membrane-associated protease RseP (regulator of RpoE activity)
VLYALARPFSFVVLLVSFVVAVTVHGWVQCLAADRAGVREPRQEQRLRPDPRRQLDPFGAVGAAISGLGWSRPVRAGDRRRRGTLLTVSLVGPATNLALGVALLVAARVSYGPLSLLAGPAVLLQHGTPQVLGLGATALVLAGLSQLYVGALSLVPLPPLDGGRLLFGLGPRGPGWQRAEHLLSEQNIGTAVLLALLLIPLGGPLPLLPALLDVVLSPAVRALLGG